MSFRDAYLKRLGVAEPGPPGVAALRALHTAHVERVAYEALDIQLGRLTSIDPVDSVERVVSGRGGYCYHLNGAFSLLLRDLGYDVAWHRAGVQNHGAPPPGTAWANHLALTVRGLEGRDWLVDVGLGDALHEPLPLSAGEYVQGPFRYRLRPSETEPDGWRLDHDPRGAFAGMDFAAAPASLADFEERHVHLSTSPDSAFVRTCAVQRRDAGGVDALTGCVLTRIGDGAGPPYTAETKTEWFGLLADVFSLTLADLGAPECDALWTRVRAAHEAWLRHRP